MKSCSKVKTSELFHKEIFEEEENKLESKFPFSHKFSLFRLSKENRLIKIGGDYDYSSGMYHTDIVVSNQELPATKEYEIKNKDVILTVKRNLYSCFLLEDGLLVFPVDEKVSALIYRGEWMYCSYNLTSSESIEYFAILSFFRSPQVFSQERKRLIASNRIFDLSDVMNNNFPMSSYTNLHHLQFHSSGMDLPTGTITAFESSQGGIVLTVPKGSIFKVFPNYSGGQFYINFNGEVIDSNTWHSVILALFVFLVFMVLLVGLIFAFTSKKTSSVILS